MTDFEFSGHDENGNKITGKRSALSAESLAEVLARENILPIEINEVQVKEKLFDKAIGGRQKVKQIELQLLCRQLYTLLKAGIPITMAIQRLSETSNNKYLAKVLQDVMKTLNQGYSLVHAFAKFPHVFSNLFLNIIKIGESTGQLDYVFLKLSEYLTLEIDSKKKIQTALRYPIMVIISVVIALLVINVFVVPNFAKMFAKFKGDLPIATKILMTTSDFLINYWMYIIAVTLAIAFAFKTYINTEDGKKHWHYIIIKLPIVGSIINRMYLARFCRLYALMIKSGLSAVDSIVLVGKATGNAYIADKIGKISDFIAKGNSISNACHQTNLFSSLVIQMLSLGEETGQIDDMLDEVGEYYEREVNYDLDRLSDLIEPILLVIMGGMVLILALGVFLPMWNMMSLVK